MRSKAYLRFYFGGGRIVRTVASHPDKRAIGYLAARQLKRLELGKLLRPGRAAPPAAAAPAGPVAAVIDGHQPLPGVRFGQPTASNL